MDKKIKKVYKKIKGFHLFLLKYLELFFLKHQKTSINGFFAIFSIVAIILVKLFVTYDTYYTELIGLSNYIILFTNDIRLLFIILLISNITFYVKNKIIKSILAILSFLLFIIFFIDIFTIRIFQSRLSLLEFYGFIDFSNIALIFSYIGILLIGFGIFAFIIYNLYKYIKTSKNNNIIFSIILFIFSFSFFISQISFYSNYRIQQNILSLNYNSISQYLSTDDLTYIKNEKTNYEDYFDTTKGQNKKLNLILVFAESFSFADSKRVGGINDNFPYFDKIQSQGITFTNVISNGCTSDNSHIAMLQGVEPRYSPNKKELKGYFKYKNYTDTLPDFFNKIGFNTIFISSAPLTFLDQRSFLENIKYKEIRGEENFNKDKKYTFDSAPDYILYNDAVDVVSQQTGNFFLTLQTISSHEPYYTPYGDSSQDMFEYVDKNLYGFYSKLKRIGFFDNGILVVISDHRKMQPLTKKEVDKYGKIAYAKILATVVGSGIQENTFNNNIVQHIDFFHSIKNYRGSGYIQISSIYNDVFLNKNNRNRGAIYCAYFDNKYGLITSSGEFSKFKNDSYIFSGGQFYSYLSAYQKYQSNLFTGALYQYSPDQEFYKFKKDLIILGHRGASAQAVENSLEAFKLAKKLGADGIEFDISFTKDNYNIVSHGPELWGTICKGDKIIGDSTLKNIKDNCPIKNGETMRTLEEMLYDIKGMFDYYFIEIKVYDKNKASQQVMAAINTVKKLGMQDKVIFISYDPTVNYIIGSYSGIIAGRDDYHTGSIDIIKDFSHSYYLLEKGYINDNVVKKVNSIGKKLAVYTVNDPLEFEKLYKLGVRMFMTDDIPLIKQKFLEIIKQ